MIAGWLILGAGGCCDRWIELFLKPPKYSSILVERLAIRYFGISGNYLTSLQIEKLQTLKANNELGLATEFDAVTADLLDDGILMSYKNGTLRRINPAIETSKLCLECIK